MQIRCGLTEIKFGKYSVAKNTGFIENSSVFNKTKTSSVFRCVRLLVESGLCASFYDAAKLECHVDITGCCNLPTTPSNGVLKLTQFEGQYSDQVKGPPNVYPAYGDKAGAWALNGVASDHYITTVAFPANEVRIEIDTTNTDEDYEIDAIKITGQC
ncbi:unnamed protein product [Mytilus edulis]|uniref:Uncharacterized protein n=1 Tax=Mytilus edulis TaxID=6550 RepID=A0A8S3S806_MYTED|nr:unnamed protein product [Mytilus edulis]